MDNNLNTKSNKKTILLITLCWLAYATSYVGKLSYNANIDPIIDAFKVSKSQAGLVGSFFFFVYGAGQIINGLLCKKYNVKYVIFTSLIVASLMNLCVVLVPSFSYIKYLWLINGAAMSFLWTSLIRLLSETLNKKDVNKAIVAMGTTVATGTCIVYGLSALFVSINYKITFYIAFALIFIVALIWLFSFNRLVNPLKVERLQETLSTENLSNNKQTIKTGGLLALISVLGCFAVANNFVKDGLTTWTPKILKEIYFTPSWLSILLTILLPVLAIFGTVVAVNLHKKVNNFVGICSILFSISSILITIVVICINFNVLPITIGCFAIVSCLMAGVNNVITSMVPLNLKEKTNSGRLAGILNGFCYLGSTLSSFGLGLIADNFGWNAVLYLLLSIAVLVVLIGIIYLIIKKFTVK